MLELIEELVRKQHRYQSLLQETITSRKQLLYDPTSATKINIQDLNKTFESMTEQLREIDTYHGLLVVAGLEDINSNLKAYVHAVKKVMNVCTQKPQPTEAEIDAAYDAIYKPQRELLNYLGTTHRSI